VIAKGAADSSQRRHPAKHRDRQNALNVNAKTGLLEAAMAMVKKIVERWPRSGRPSLGVTTSPKDSVGAKIHEILLRDPSRDLANSRKDSPNSGGQKKLLLKTRPAVGRCFKVLIADDHPVVRSGLAWLLGNRSDMQIIGEAKDGREAVEQFSARRPDIALLDLRMPVMDGIQAVAQICEKDPSARLVILTTFQSEEDIYRALRAGAQGYLIKDAPVEELVGCIHAVCEGRSWIPPSVGAKLAKRVTDRELTRREMETMQAIARGKSNKEIGCLFDISEATVKVHVTHILEKLKVTGRTEAINVAVRRGLVEIDSALIA
jgi:two-component system NarL family response regulator